MLECEDRSENGNGSLKKKVNLFKMHEEPAMIIPFVDLIIDAIHPPLIPSL